MSRALTRTSKLDLQQKIRNQLSLKYGIAPPAGGSFPRTSALLLDISGSMNEFIGANVRKIDELRKLAQNFGGARQFQFSCTCEELQNGNPIGSPRGGTAMDVAFLECKRSGIDHVVLITDGRPDHEQRAINAAHGLKIDCFYVGPDPAPEFLRDLCRATGGQYGKASLEARAALESGVRKLLEGGTAT